MMKVPIACHDLTEQQHLSGKWISHAPRDSHEEAHDLRPCGLPPGERYNPEFNREVEKHLS